MKNKRIPIYIILLICFAIPSVYANSAIDSKKREDARLREKIESCISKDEKDGVITPERAANYRFQMGRYFRINSMLTTLKNKFWVIRILLSSLFVEAMKFIAIACVPIYSFVYWISGFSIASKDFDRKEQLSLGLGLKILFMSFIAGLVQGVLYKIYQNYHLWSMDVDERDRYLLYDYLIKNGFYSLKESHIVWQTAETTLGIFIKFIAVLVVQPFFLFFMILFSAVVYGIVSPSRKD